MNEHFIKEIEIKNFKLFKDFKAKGFGRVNLIGGKNNVGKTAFMEAVCVNVYATDINSFYTTLLYSTFTREKLEFINKLIDLKDDKRLFENIKFYDSKTNINEVKYQLIEEDGIKKYEFVIKNQKHIININEFSYAINLITSILFLDNKGFTNKFLQKLYIEVQKKDKEEDLNRFISHFEKSIEKFKMFDDSPECKLNNENIYRKLSEFGDGLRSYISIISALYACSDSYLFIDEIENGIHYTNLDKLWEIILTVSKEQNVQVFATTHSKECIESYARVAKRLGDEEIVFIELGRNKNNELDSIVMDSEMFQRFIKLGNEVRGW